MIIALYLNFVWYFNSVYMRAWLYDVKDRQQTLKIYTQDTCIYMILKYILF